MSGASVIIIGCISIGLMVWQEVRLGTLSEVLLIRELLQSRRTYLMAVKFIHHTLHGPHNCYFDETEKDDIIGVAGWVGTFENWMAL